MRRLLSIVCVWLLSLLTVCYAVQSTEGTEFWATFLNNYNAYEGSSEMTLKLIASSRENATVTVKNPRTGWSTSFTVQANQVAEKVIPHAQCYTREAETVSNRGLKITSTAPISLYASNFIDYTYDATIVLPVTALGTEYVVQVFENELYSKEFGVVATADNTQLTITPHSRTTGGHVKNVSFTVTLNAGQTYQVMSSDGGSDFSGSRVESTKPIAVFAGHQCINVPTDNPWCDHIVEQQMPTTMWGKQFVLTKSMGMRGDRIMVTAKEPNTHVFINGAEVATLNALESYTFRQTANSAFMETSEPVTCFLYIEGARDNDMMGDPSSIHVSPIEQRIGQLTFSTFETNISRTHYVNIITTKDGAFGMVLDGQNIAGSFAPVAGNNSLRFARLNISHGTHTLSTPMDGFIGHVYGLGYCESYAYTFGSATLNLDGAILVDGEPHADIIYTEARCYKAPIHFAARANIDFTSIHWDFGDGTTSTETEVTHTYPAAGTYTITMAIANEDSQDTARTTLTLYETMRDTIITSICEGDKYTLGGHVYQTAGQYEVTFPTESGCDSVVTLYLSVHDKKITVLEAEFRMGSAYYWNNQWYYEGGVYYDTLVAANGCDSILELHLTEVDPTEITKDTICWQQYYPFHGYNFPLPSIVGYEDRDYINYTLEYFDKVECLTYRLNLAIIPKDGNGVFETFDTIQFSHTYQWFDETLTQEGTYTKVFGGGSECRQEYILHLAVVPFPIEVTERTLCHADTVHWRGAEYQTPGVYTDTVYSPLGIEGIYRLVLRDLRSTYELSVNNVEFYDFNGKHLTQSGTYRDTIPNADGCDSIIILHLGIHEPCEIQVEENMRLCEGETYEWNDIVCEPGNDYQKQFISVGGCDSIVTLHIEKLEKKQTIIDTAICEGDYFRAGSQRFTEEGDFMIPLLAANGCDSTVLLHLELNKVYRDTAFVTINIGETYEWEEESYRRAGFYSKGFVADNGCDSIRCLQLRVNRDCQGTRDTTATICYGTALEWYGQTYDADGEYTHLLEFTDRCDTLVTLHLTVRPVSESHENHFLFTGETYEWHNNTYSETGVYSYLTTDSHGCDSTVYLHLTVSDKPIYDSLQFVQQCDGETYIWFNEILTPTVGNTVFTHRLFGEDTDTLITLTFDLWPRYDNVEITEYVCEQEAFAWHNETFLEADDYTRTFESVHGCDSIVTLHLRHYPRYENVLDEREICEGESTIWEGTTYSTATEETRMLQSVHGCDSIVTFRLTVWPRYEGIEETRIICEGTSTEWHNETFSAAGDYTRTFESVHGCDSIVTLHLRHYPRYEMPAEEHEICAGETFVWNDHTYSTAGDHTLTLPTIHGCDSVVTLRLIVWPRYDNIEITEYVCAGESYTWQGTTYTDEGDYPYTFESVHGCDSIVTLHLRHYPRYENVLDEREICEGESTIWEGTTYSTATEETRMLQSVHGCDSIVTFRLTVWPRYEGIEETRIICEGTSTEWHNETFSAAGDYTRTFESVHGCDSVVTLHLQLNERYEEYIEDTLTIGQTYIYEEMRITEPGDYTYTFTTVNGCDSIIRLHLLENNVQITSVYAPAQCANEDILWLNFTYTGKAHQGQILFDAKGHAAGLRDTTLIIASNQDIRIPMHVRAGEYNCTVRLFFRGEEATSRTFVCTVLFPASVLEQAWNDVIAVLTHDYNGGYDFVAFQWYENGVQLVGETKSYLYRPLIMGAEYNALLTEMDGTQLMTCGLIAQEQEEISLYPTVVTPKQQITCVVHEAADIILYDALGHVVLHRTLVRGENIFAAPANAGSYIAKIHLMSSEATKIIKIMVQ